MNTAKKSVVVGVFERHEQADQAVSDLLRAGFSRDQIGVAALDPAKRSEASVDTESNATVGALSGAVAGAGAGSLVGLGILAGVIPAIGPIIAGGTLAVILANAAGGAAIAGLIGALIGAGVPEEEARHYEGELKAGRTIVTVQRVDGRYDEAWSILHRHGAWNKSIEKATASCASGPGRGMGCAETAGVAGSGQSMKLHEEELHVQKHPVKTGEVRVRKEVVTENKVLNVPVQREEIVIERRAQSGQVVTDANLRSGEEIRVPVREDRVQVNKDTVVKEEVNVSKRAVQGTEQVTGAVRMEKVRVEREGDVKVCDTTTGKTTGAGKGRST